MVKRMSFVEKLRMLYGKQNWSQEKLSKMVNLHRSGFSRYDTGKSIPGDETLLNLQIYIRSI
ncbi:helix-turn-helix domain-containing protein [Neobacillus mesonae]|uniref:helix-turn-helix domain-containing protein n=1 Tax=Neobacillus mesonae TaxID=1193713 RepID=UPI0037CBCA9D